MDYTEKIEINGGKTKNAFIRKAGKVISRWGMKMPDEHPPLLLDFGKGEFSKTGHIEYWIVNDEKNGYCGKFIFMFKGQTCPAHSHNKKHETFMVVRGAITMRVDGKKVIRMKQGQVLKMPQKSLHTFTAEKDSLILEVSQPSVKKDNFFADNKIGII
jgi:quercetin dioxygenase-like cupin family protein